MPKKVLSLGEKIALAASGSHEEDFPEDIEYETSAKVVELDEELEYAKPSRSSLRTKNIQLLDEIDAKYLGSKVSRKQIEKAGELPELQGRQSTRKVSLPSSTTEDEGIDESMDDEEEDDEDSLDGDLDDEEDDVEKANPQGRFVRAMTAEDEESGEDEDDSQLDDDEDASDDDDDNEDEEQMSDEAGADEDDTVQVQTLSLKDKQAEIEKGKATLNQIRMWDSLLEARIRLQKMLIDCNRLPRSSTFQELVNTFQQSPSTSSVSSGLENSQEAVKLLMHNLTRLQEVMVQKNSETRNALQAKSPVTEEADTNPDNEEITSEEDEDENEPSDNEENQKPSNRKRKSIEAEANLTKVKKMKPEEFISSAEITFSSFLPYRDQTIQKWNDKTQFAGGKFNNKKSSHHISTMKQIQQILSNKERLLKRTQVRRTNYTKIGGEAELSNEAEEKIDPEIFDDDDFYHQLLRELIERKTSNVNDPIQLSRHWLELQKLRSKLKKKVDTKASKGRRIRYEIHSKLVNFMAPQDKCVFSATAVNELFSSLFGGKKKE